MLPAAGGIGQGSDSGTGGAGGAGSTPAGQPSTLNNYDSGGGGGGVGRIRVNATSALVTATVSPAATTGPLKTSALP